MKYKFIQVNCIEGDNIDLRQAESILKYKPDIVLLEYPNNNKTPNTIYNSYKPNNKPLHLIKEQQKRLQRHIKTMPWVKSDIVMWENIEKLWKMNHQVLVYRTDAPNKLTNEWFEVWNHMYPCAKRNWLWWVQIYLREKYMAKNTKWILDNIKVKDKKELTVLVFLQSFHWRHVKFLLKDPSTEKIWNYYFGKFPQVNKNNISEKIKNLNMVFYKHWVKISDFVI
ncbi:hypothetical protein ISR94_02800 [Candidatus Microgenomates bacterium]|nr:hypothetical protein [Candidatus Microgenomates bacterium]